MPDHQHWMNSFTHFFLPVKLLSRVFCWKFVAGLRRAAKGGQLAFNGECLPLAAPQAFAAFLHTLLREDWVVYAKPPFDGPEHVVQYLARYTHRVAISNHRIEAVTDSHVTCRWKDYAHDSPQRAMTLTSEEFLHRFVQHVLPKGSRVFATSGDWPTAGAKTCFRSAACSSTGRSLQYPSFRSATPPPGSAPIATVL